MKTPRFVASLALSLLPVALFAQTSPEIAYSAGSDGPPRSFALVVQSSLVSESGDWHAIAQLAHYAQRHPGTYIVFTQDGVLRRLDTPKGLAEAQHLYDPVRQLAKSQEVLAAEQKPLAEQQQSLGAQQRAATDPHQMTRIGAAQAALGREQGDLGQQQGAIGREQGELGRVAYHRVQSMLDACVADRSCLPVTDETAQR